MIVNKCPDCDIDIEIPDDIEVGNVISCPCCGLELEWNGTYLIELVIDGEDFGE